MRRPSASGAARRRRRSRRRRAALARLTLPPLHAEPRADWAASRPSAVFALAQHDALLEELRALPDVRAQPVPAGTLAFFRQQQTALAPSPADADAVLARVPPRLGRTLLPFQRAAVRRIAGDWGGRALLADEMGLGKTLQALAVVGALRAWPVLLVAPAALRLMWAEEIEKWLPELLAPSDILVLRGATDALQQDAPTPKVVVTSFRMASVLRASLGARTWRTLVVDESHVLTSTSRADDAAHTQAVAALGAAADHVLLLSGTPSLSKPFQMWRQVEIVRPGLLGADKWAFGRAYCTSVRSGAGFWSPTGGGQRDHELHLLLRASLMVRRLKADVLSELPAKRRQWLRLPLTASDDGADVDDADAAAEPAAGASSPSSAAAADASPSADADPAASRSEYEAAGLAKLPAVRRLLLRTLRSTEGAAGGGAKLVVFAHHRKVVSALSSALHAARVSHVRIDGAALPADRHDAVRRFAADASLRVALASVTASALGIDLSAASVALFAELPPDAAWLNQAEDRLHRRGQRAAVQSTLLLAAPPPAADAGADATEAGSAAMAAAARFDARHSRTLRAAERCVRRVTDGPRTRTLPPAAAAAVTDDDDDTRGRGRVTRSRARGSEAAEVAEAEEEAAEAAEEAEEAAAWAAARPTELRFEVSAATGLVHVFRVAAAAARVTRRAAAAAAAPDAGGGGDGCAWRLHAVYSADELRAAPSEEAEAPRAAPAPAAARFVVAWEACAPAARRRLRRLGPLPLPLPPPPRATGAAVGGRSTRRVRPRLEPEEGAPEGTRWEVASVVGGYTAAMPLALSAAGAALCLGCYAELQAQPAPRESPYFRRGAPLALVDGGGDGGGGGGGGGGPSSPPPPSTSPSRTVWDASELFCGGGCRAAYFARRSTAALRRQLSDADEAVCAGCGVDCRALVRGLQAAPPGAPREALLRALARAPRRRPPRRQAPRAAHRRGVLARRPHRRRRAGRRRVRRREHAGHVLRVPSGEDRRRGGGEGGAAAARGLGNS